MLKQFRKKKTRKTIFIFLAIVIVPAFVFWGSSSLLRSKQESQYAGKIFGRPVSFLEYQDALRALRNLALIQYGDKFEEAQNALDLDTQAWERLILLNEVKIRKIKCSDKEVIEYIRSYPFFKDKSGQFDQRAYEQMLQFVFRTQARAFEEQTRQNLEISKLYQEITKGLSLSDEEVKEEYRKANEEVSLVYILSQSADFLKTLEPSDSELRQYFQQNPQEFKQPLSFNLQYMALSAEDKDAVNKVKKIYWRLKLWQDFVKVGKDFGLEVKETGIFAENEAIPGIGWLPQITTLLVKTSTGRYLKPYILENKYYVIKLKERKEPYVPQFESIKNKVKEVYLKEKSKQSAKAKIEECLKKLNEAFRANPKSLNLEAQAKIFGLRSGVTAPFKYGSYIEGIGASDSFWNAAQNLKNGESSGIIEMPSGFYIIKIKSTIPFDEKKFASETGQFRDVILLQKKQEKFTQFLEDLKRRAQRY